MANFRTHVSFSSMLGCGYAAAGYSMGVPWETALVGGGLCGLSGMLPDLDSDSGIPLRESMAFAAAIVPVLLLDRLRELELRHDQFVLLAAGLYFFVRFGVTKMIAGRTSHRGMFHSIPAAMVFAGAAFLLCSGPVVTMRYFKAGGVFLGVMSHLVLDEYYSFEVKRGKIRVKRSFGTALKFWSKDGYSNFSTYAKLVVIVGMILCEPAVMDRLEGRAPTFTAALERMKQRYFNPDDGIGPLEAFHKQLQGQFRESTQNGQFAEQPSPNSRSADGLVQPSIESPAGDQPPAANFRPGVNYFEAQANPPPATR